MRIVLLAVDNLVTRAGLHKILSACDRLAITDARGNPDVVIVEIEHGPGTWETAPARYAPAPVLAVAHASPGLLSRAALAGVNTCLVHGRFTETELVTTVLGLTPRPRLVAPPLLCVREAETMDLISRGLSNEEISRLLNVRVKTIKNRINSIFSKLGARHRAEAVAIWLGTSRGALTDVV